MECSTTFHIPYVRKGSRSRFGAALAGGLSLVVFKRLISDAAQSRDRLGTFSDEVGLSVNELRGFQLGADLTGTSMETLEKVLQRTIRCIGEAKTGFGEGVSSLKALGLSAEDLTKVSTAEALKTVAGAI